MARGWGNAPPDLKGTLGTLLRTTLFQLGTLRDVAVREIRSGGRELAGRAGGAQRSHRTEVLASLGEIIYELARSGELDLEEFPELAALVTELASIDSINSTDSIDSRDVDAMDADLGSAGAWSGLMDDWRDGGEAFDDDDGTVSAFSGTARTSGTARGTTQTPSAPPRGVWRPNPDDYDESGQLRTAAGKNELAAAAGTSADGMATVNDAPTEPVKRPARRTGGASRIAFVDDDAMAEDDLEDYMHEDDVPEKT